MGDEKIQKILRRDTQGKLIKRNSFPRLEGKHPWPALSQKPVVGRTLIPKINGSYGHLKLYQLAPHHNKLQFQLLLYLLPKLERIFLEAKKELRVISTCRYIPSCYYIVFTMKSQF